MSSTAIAILAAGASSRFSACKHLAMVNDKTIIEWLVKHCENSKAQKVIVISGCHHQAMCNALPAMPLLENKHWQRGLSSSIAFACEQLQQFDRLMIILGDQLALTTTDINRLIETRTEKPIVSAHYSGKAGVPAIFNRTVYEKLGQLHGDKGAKTLLNDPKISQWLDMPNAEIDIDTQENLIEFKHRYADCLF